MKYTGQIAEINPFAKFFLNFIPKSWRDTQQQISDNSQGQTQEELEHKTSDNYDSYADLHIMDFDFEQYFSNKKSRVHKYREMALSPEVSDALDNICDEAIVKKDNAIAVLNFENDDMNDLVKKRIRATFDYLHDKVYKLNRNGWNLFYKWLVDGELYLELIMNSKKDNIIGFKVLPPYTMFPIREGDEITGYVQKQVSNKGTVGDEIKQFARNQIVHVKYFRIGKDEYDVRGYLEASIKPYNMLRSLEDSILVYRLVRAPERRIWNIDVGRMPKGKAEAYIKGMIQRYKKKVKYNSETGDVDSTANLQSISEDYWFARSDEGKGTSVDTLDGGMNLGELTDVDYFLRKLYKTLKLPRSRWEDPSASTYSGGKMGEISREEVKFASYVNRLQNIFVEVLMNPFMTLLAMRGFDEKYIDRDLYEVFFHKSNLFAEYRKYDLLETKLAILGTASSFIMTPENYKEPDKFFDKDFVLKDMFLFSDEEYEKNQQLFEAKLKEAAQGMDATPPDVTQDVDGDGEPVETPLQRAQSNAEQTEAYVRRGENVISESWRTFINNGI